MPEAPRLAAGDAAPDFTLATDTEGNVNLYDLLEEGRRSSSTSTRPR